MKKLIVIVWCVCLLIFGAVLLNYMQNNKLIRHSEQGIASSSDLPFLSFLEPYVYHYNKGNVLYSQGDYDNAEASYRKALVSVPKDKDCQVRINLALSMVKPLTPESVNEDNVDDVVATLEDARDILVENGCAHADDEDGHNQDAQTLKDEIDVYLDQIRQAQKNPSDGSKKDSSNSTEESTEESTEDTTEESTQDSTEQSTEESTQDSTKDESTETNSTTEEANSGSATTQMSAEQMEKEFLEMQRQGAKERGATLEEYKQFGKYEYFDGKSW